MLEFSYPKIRCYFLRGVGIDPHEKKKKPSLQTRHVLLPCFWLSLVLPISSQRVCASPRAVADPERLKPHLVMEKVETELTWGHSLE